MEKASLVVGCIKVVGRRVLVDRQDVAWIFLFGSSEDRRRGFLQSSRLADDMAWDRSR